MSTSAPKLNDLDLSASMALAFGMGREKFTANARRAGLSGKRARKLYLRAKRNLLAQK